MKYRNAPRYLPICQHKVTRPVGFHHSSCVRCGAMFAVVRDQRASGK